MVLRGAVWLVALLAFVLPPAVMPATAATPMAPASHAGMHDCPFHAPTPPENCPSEGPAKHHAGGLCCLVMLHVIALPPATAEQAARALPASPSMHPVHDLVGIILNKDPPPPRV